MKKGLNKKERAKMIEKAITLTWSSLDSHLSYTYAKQQKGESQRFHKTAVLEYAEIILILAKLY